MSHKSGSRKWLKSQQTPKNQCRQPMLLVKRSWTRNWIAITATLVHLVWGVVLLFDSAPLHTTPLGLIHKMGVLGNQYVSAAVYISASVMAGVPLVFRRYDTTFLGLALSGPQQFLLMVSFFTAAMSVVTGSYPDGYVPDTYGSPRLFIACDQLWPAVGMVAHTLSLVDWYVWSRKGLR